MVQPIDNKIDQCQENNIETLLEWLGSLRITKEDTLEETTEYTDEISVVLVSATVQNEQAVMLKSIVLDLG